MTRNFDDVGPPGSNLPNFRAVQLDFAAHIRNPQHNPRPSDVSSRRMQIYLDLFFNNIKSFLDSTFPVCRRIVGEEQWRALAREFVHTHPSESPYFLQISQEFMTFLDQRGLHDLPPFLLELAHYEWVELALDVAEDIPLAPHHVADSLDDPFEGRLVLTPHFRSLAYRYPVHQLSPDYQPSEPPSAVTYLIAYRTAAEVVRFKASNALSHRLLSLLADGATVAEVVEVLQGELREAGRDIALDLLEQQAQAVLREFRDAGIVLGRSSD